MKKHIPQTLIAFGLLTYPAFADGPPAATTGGSPAIDIVAAQPRPFSHPDRIRYDSQCFTIDGKDVFIFSGAFQYFRCPKELWPQRFQAIKDAGFNTVESYEAWNYHEPDMPDSLSDFSKIVRLDELDDWLTMAEKFGFYIIVRPGPYICAEWSNGGYPRWMSTLEKPATPLRKEAWLRSDDPVYLAWCKHWYDAVCPVIAKHQITRKAPGEPGVILFQIENEYNYSKLPNDVKVNDLTALVQDAEGDGIDVPLFTCFTSQTRSARSGPLRAVFDCTNFYPKLKIEKNLGRDLKAQRIAQTDAPLGTSELQGGWFAQVGGKLSDQQPGITQQQIQNLTLYAWQMGDTMTNYYMLFGGTNFGDWAGADNITSYDYNAPIREDGGISERYQRVWGLGQFIHDHGAGLTRAQGVDISATASDKDVEIAERKALDGSRYIFVRTENADSPRAGTAQLTEKDGTNLAFDYKLEPFGSMVLYLPPGVTDAKKGEWLPKPAPAMKKPANLPEPVLLTQALRSFDSQPVDWQPLKPGAPVESVGIFGSHFFYYRITAKPGATITLQIQRKDGIAAASGGTLLKGTADKTKTHITFALPPDQTQMVVLYENMGHENFGPNVGEPFGILSAQGNDGPLEITRSTGLSKEEEYGEKLTDASNSDANAGAAEQVDIGKETPGAPDALVTWYRMRFQLPEKQEGLAAPWHLHLEANGNGFIYINGHCLGRYRQAGPQHDFFLPGCWLNYGSGEWNRVAVDLRPLDKGVSLQAVSVAPDASFAVETAAVGQ